MSDITYNPEDYNNGIPPEPGLVWKPGGSFPNGSYVPGSWGWPTRGYDVPPLPGDTEMLTVTPKETPADTWPKRPDIKEWYVPGEKPFDPSTGNGWVPDVDGYGEVLPAGIPAVVQAAINKVKGAPLKGGMSAVDIWKLKPATEYPGRFNSTDPAFSWFPVRALTDTDISAMPVAPETVPVHTRILDNVHDGVQFVSAVFAGSMHYNLPVVKAQATAGSDYYTIGRLPGIMSAFTFSFYTKGTPQDSRFFRNTVKAGGDLREAGFTVGANTSDFIIWFPQGSGLEPLYFSMTMNMPAEPLQRRQEAENKARAEADRLRAEAEAKIRAEAEARAKAEADRKALFTKAGISDTPVYTPEMVKASNAALSAGGAMALSRAPGMIQLSAASAGTLPFNSGLAGWEAGALWRGVDVLARIAPVASAVATVATVLTLVRAALDIPAAGEGSDRVPGRNIDMLAAQASLYTAMKTNIQPGMKTVDLPVRGYISYDGNGRQSVNLVRTGTGGVSATVPVLSAVRDKTTGLDKITVPAVAGAPSRTILINPVPVGPAAPSHTGSSTPVPVTPVHTGTDVKQADSIVTTTLPSADIPALQDFIYWQPDATGTGVEPIYVMTSNPRRGVTDYGHDYHPAPKTEEIKGLGELKESRKKTPKQGGGGRRDRWIGDKGRKIYEWDSQHGELEGYRASDGSHLGAFDPKTGKQVKGSDPKRNIKKYL
ncbi:colicin-like bacteriocin tRNase domain-containing protein (plasmid) [Klebsiella michiganensis]|uniref:colicin-like bacteriocin tRNase domain-containing protein n=1 Tax=Klebsiella michiganensis TaxID=1134687 RepID=UPI00265A614B|nr:colicin-like bacteriocin tRNase domain-containing protein [Klebsiella michiganensis]WKK01099.1 colicin-like bacteriocin tRNase domain-containing protein [Klebsiella michiganensis]WKK03830.1 colicin-like bacteriocin tRNase domain-containing protein [Klebsiella michiganensis]WKK06919.1 colicin-like bacteriocin tRNase domain-containing protein [Klebsiella michiganensis]WKK07056.1 colicin-like bacteriocin tRNase domain-containing protein [Klebsiella michiganensis]